MFKFFRKYNKIILVFGGVLLMFAFLVQGSLQMFYGSATDQPVGTTAAGRTITLGDQGTAAAEVQVLNKLNPLLGLSARLLEGGDQPLKWVLMIEDAKRMGIAVSDAQVDQMLQAIGAKKEEIRQAAYTVSSSPAFVRQAVRHWLMLDQYQQLVLGQTYDPPLEPLVRIQRIEQLAQAYGQRLSAQYLASVYFDGDQRVSQPLIRHFLHEAEAQAKGELVLVPASHYLSEAPAPTQGELQELFKEYRKDLPGQSEPYGFGYRLPNRVKIEYLSVSIPAAMRQVQVDEAEVLQYYDQHKNEFRPQPAGTQPATQPAPMPLNPTPAVRRQIVEQLRRQKAEALATQVIKGAQGELLDHIRSQPKGNDGYRSFDKNFHPLSFQALAADLAKRYRIRPRVQNLTQDWITQDQLSKLPGLGNAVGLNSPKVHFVPYVLSTHELKPASSPLVALGLQVDVPSMPMVDARGTRYIFRITAAQPSRVPDELEDVREQVVRDAKLLKAYGVLQQRQDKLIATAKQKGLGALAEQANASVRQIPLTPQRVPTYAGLEVPDLPAVGQSKAFVAAFFERAQEASRQGKRKLTTVPRAKRVGAVALDEELGLAVFEVDQYQPLSEQAFEQQLSQAGLTRQLSNIMLPDADQASLSLEAIEKRVGFKAAESHGTTPNGSNPLQQRPRPVGL